MACAVDASSPIRWTGTITPSGTIASASFTAPANSYLVACVNLDTDSTGNATFSVSDSGGLTWGAVKVARTDSETTAGGTAGIFAAIQVTSAARTVTVTWTSGGAGSPPRRASATCYVVTGADVAGTPIDTVGANNEGGSGTNNLTTTSITPGATGLLFACDTEWNTLGAFEASSDLTQDTATYAGAISVCSGYKTCTSGVGVTANLNAAGAGTPQHKWCQVIVREAAGVAFLAGEPVMVRQAVNRAGTY